MPDTYNSIYTGTQIDEGIGTARAARGVSGILKGDGAGGVSGAIPSTDFAVPVKKDFITIGTTWSGVGPYTQTVTLASYTPTAFSKVDLQPDAAAIAQLINDGVKGLYISNTNGTLTAYAVGGTISSSITVQVTVTEVTS